MCAISATLRIPNGGSTRSLHTMTIRSFCLVVQKITELVVCAITWFCPRALPKIGGRKMRKVEPKVFLVGETRVVEEGLQSYLAHLGVPDWVSDAPTDAERLVEVMGRLCYRSFKPGLNPNVTKVREHNGDYIANILSVKHGSVIEHPVMNFIFADVSRVFTHELVRHRPGVAISQESLRFVRLNDLGQWLPTVIREDPEAMAIFVRTFDDLERQPLELAKHYDLDAAG